MRKQEFTQLASDEDNQDFLSKVIEADLDSMEKFVMFVANLGDTLTIKTLDLMVKGLQLLDVNPIMYHMHNAIFAFESKLIFVERMM